MRDLHADTAEALAGETLAPIGMVELAFESGTLRLWTGLGDLLWNEQTWTGAGSLGRLSAVQETTEIRAVGVDMGLSGIPAEVLAIALAQNWQGRAARVYFGVLDGRAFVGEPVCIFAGLMDQMTLVEGGAPEIRLTAESSQIDLERTKVRRYTPEDQRSEYPGDKGCDQVAALQEIEIIWGRA